MGGRRVGNMNEASRRQRFFATLRDFAICEERRAVVDPSTAVAEKRCALVTETPGVTE